MPARPPVEYKGFCIEVTDKPPEMDAAIYCGFKARKIGQPQISIDNGKQYGGYEVALAEAKICIDNIPHTDSR